MTKRMHMVAARPLGVTACRRGATAIEFALVAPVLMLFIIGIIEISLIMFTWSVLEGATNIGARIGKTGYTNNGESREQYIRDTVTQLSGGYLDQTALNFTITNFVDFSQFDYQDDPSKQNYRQDVANLEPCIAPNPPPCSNPGQFVDANHNGMRDQLGNAGVGSGAQSVLYTVTYPWPIFTPLMAQFFGNVFQISAIAAIKNEPF